MANPYPAGSAQAAAYENAKYRGTQPFVGSAPVTRQISIDFVGETPVVQDPDNPNRYVPAREQNPIDRTPVYQARLQELWNVQQRQQQQQTQQQQQQIRQQEYAEQSQFLATRNDRLTTYYPYGDRAQTELRNTKNVINPITGEIATYQLKPGRTGENEWDWQLAGGGSRAAAQSGMFSINEPLTPIVFTQESGGERFAESANVPLAESILANPMGYSRLGAEAYGGYVTPLDNRTIASSGARLSTYANPNNLANYANPQGVNLSKHQAPGSDIPWSIPPGLPAISFMNEKGLVQSDRVVGGKTVATAATVSTQTPAGLPSPFISGVKTTPASGNIPLVPKRIVQGAWGLPAIEFAEVHVPFLEHFQEPTVERYSPQTKQVDITKMGGVDYQRGFIDMETGKPTNTLAFYRTPTGELTPVKSEGVVKVGEKYKVGEPFAVGKPKVSSIFDPSTGITTTTTEQEYQQEYQQDVTQDAELVTLPSNIVTVRPMIQSKGQSDFNQWVKEKIPERKTETLNDGKTFYLLGDDLGSKVDTAITGQRQFIASAIPGSPQWSRETMTNIRENPGFGIPVAVFSIGLASIGVAGRSAGIGETLLAPTTRAGGAYQFGSQVATAGLVTMFADYGMKEVTGTGLFDVAQNEYKRAVSGGKSESTWNMMQRNFQGWDTASRNVNRVELEAGIAAGAYIGANYIGNKATDYLRTRHDVRVENPNELIVPAAEGFPTNPALTTRDLVTSFERGRMATIPESKLGLTRFSASDRLMTPTDFPANPQRLAAPGTTDVFSGADYPHLNTGYVGAGHSEISGMSMAPSGLSYFTKPGTGMGGFGISNDIFGFYRLPVMYVSGQKSGQYTRIPESVLRTPTRGMSINDPMNPRNIAITNWMDANAPYGEVAIGQHGKSEFEFHVKAGSEASTKRIGYYVDAGRRIPIERVTFTGKVSPNYEAPAPRTPSTNVFSGVPVKSSGVSSNKMPAPFVMKSSTPRRDKSLSYPRDSYGVSPSVSSKTGTSRSPSSRTTISRSFSSVSGKSGRSGSVSSGVDTSRITTPSIIRSTGTTPSRTTIKSPTVTPSRNTVTEPYRTTITTPLITTKTVTTKTPPPTGGIPLFGGAGSYHPQRPEKGYKWREHAPTITPGEMASSLFTGSFTKRQPRRQSQANVNTISLFGKSKRRKR